MAQTFRIGIIGGGWPGKAHARGYQAESGFKLTAVADLIPERRQALMKEFKIPSEFSEARDLLASDQVDAVSLCLPNYLHAPIAIAALKAGKHVLCEMPPALNLKEARQIEAAVDKSGKTLLYAAQRRFGGNEQAARQAIQKGHAGTVYHARSAWTRTRGIPIGTGWFTDASKSGGGALIDLGAHMLDLAWFLLGQPRPASVFAATHRRIDGVMPREASANVEEAAFALVRFEEGQSLELAASWAMNQSPSQNGTICRIHGDQGAVDVYTGAGAVVHRSFDAKGESSQTPLKLPKTVGHAAMMRHFRECILGTATPTVGAKEGVALMRMIEGMYRSAESGKSVEMRL